VVVHAAAEDPERPVFLITGTDITERKRHEGEVRRSRARIVAAADDARRRLERNLHDGAQQRLIALRMKVGIAARLLDQDPRRAAELLREMGVDVEAAIAELRALAHGVVPPVLVERGLPDALRDAVQRTPMAVIVDIEDVGRCDHAAEGAVYFCCLEALQNAAKHAGIGATVTLKLRRHADALHFCVQDDGAGRPTADATQDGQGLANMRKRIEDVGGKFEALGRPGAGFSVTGTVPAWPRKKS
jgi:signal transduction histidine kinase